MTITNSYAFMVNVPAVIPCLPWALTLVSAFGRVYAVVRISLSGYAEGFVSVYLLSTFKAVYNKQ